METRAPLLPHNDTVRSEWIDFNGHMNVAYYVLAFDRATDRLLKHLGLGEEYATRGNFFAGCFVDLDRSGIHSQRVAVARRRRTGHSIRI
jgi:hypothetical protein